MHEKHAHIFLRDSYDTHLSNLTDNGLIIIHIMSLIIVATGVTADVIRKDGLIFLLQAHMDRVKNLSVIASNCFNHWV